MSQQVHSTSSPPDNQTATASENGSPGSAVPQVPVAEVEAAQLSPTQQAIRSILDTGSLEILDIRALAKLEVRPLPANVAADERKPGRFPRTCCFDAENKAWTANELCTRCMLLSKVLRAQEIEVASEMMKGIKDSAFNCTDCNSETQGTGETPTLPQELLDFVIGDAIAHMERTKDSGSVRALLHVSRKVRGKVAEAFTTISLFGLTPRSSTSRRQLLTPRKLETFLWDALEWNFLTDFSLKPCNLQVQETAVSRQSCNLKEAPVIGEWLETMATIQAATSTHVYFEVRLVLAGPVLGDDARFSKKLVGQAMRRISYDEDEDGDAAANSCVNVRDGCEAAQLAIMDVLDLQAQSKLHYVNFANPYFRALQGTFGPPEARAQFEVCCWMRDEPAVDDALIRAEASKIWSFETVRA